MSEAIEACEQALRALWRHAPVSATFLGIHDYDHLLSGYDPDSLQGKRSELGDCLRRVESARRTATSLTEGEQLDLELVARELKTTLRCDEELRLPFRSPVGYLEDATFGVYILMLRRFSPAVERARAVAARLAQVRRVLAEAERNLSRPEEVPPIWGRLSADLTASALEFFGQVVSWAVREAPAMAGEVEHAAGSAREAVSRFEDFLARRVRPAARGEFAIGKDLFEFILRESHGLPDRASELEQFGRDEIRRTLGRLREEAGGDETEWERIVEFCRRDLPSPDRLVQIYQEEIGRARQFVRDRELLSLPPEESLEVIETPVFERKTTPFAAYIPPAPFESDPRGYFWVTPPDASLTEEERRRQLGEHMLPAIPITSVHEGYPGHHLQFSLAHRIPSKARRQIWTPVLVEGWALYCEEMMGEQGYYSDPRTRLLQLKDYLWRCCRVVIDVGLHVGGLSTDEAARMLAEVGKLNPAAAAGEVKRYTRTPTQPLSYAIGKREILRLREELRGREGSEFSWKRFHDRLLQYGAIPVGLIREQLLASPQA